MNTTTKTLQLESVEVAKKMTFAKFKCLERLILKDVEFLNPKGIKFHKDAKLKYLEYEDTPIGLNEAETFKIFKQF